MAVIKQILVPVSNITAALDFYSRTFGFSVKFRDGDRYAALDGGGVTLALTAQEESLAEGVTFSVITDDVAAFIEAGRSQGLTVLSGVAEGPHEKRAVVGDTDGNPVVVYSKTV